MRQFEIGSTVMLKSEGPSMTVTGHDGALVQCMYFELAAGWSRVTVTLDERCLVAYPAVAASTSELRSAVVPSVGDELTPGEASGITSIIEASATAAQVAPEPRAATPPGEPPHR
jgi:uncharacterized protein YodC (DUF2158 family)